MQRLQRWSPVAWAVGAYVPLLAIPLYGWTRQTQSSGGAELNTAGRATLAAVNGHEVFLMLAIPVVAASLAALPWPPRLHRAATITAAVITSVFVVLTSVGFFFLPCAIALIALARKTKSSSQPAT